MEFERFVDPEFLGRALNGAECPDPACNGKLTFYYQTIGSKIDPTTIKISCFKCRSQVSIKDTIIKFVMKA